MSEAGQSERSSSRRRSRRSIDLPRTAGQKGYDYLLLALMIPGTFGSVFLFGGTVGWAAGLFMALGLFAAFLFFLRPSFMADYRAGVAPLGGFLWLLVLGYVLFRYFVKPLVPYEIRIEALHIASYIAAYWVWHEIGRSRNRWRWLAALGILLVTMIAWYAIIQHVQGSRMVLWQERPIDYGMRASGTYICPNHFAHLLVVVVCFSFALVLNPGAGAPLRFVSGYAVLVMTPAIFFAFSRSAILGLVIGVSLIVILMAWRQSKMRLFGASLLLPIVILIVGFTLYRSSEGFHERVDKTFRGDVRQEIWPDTLDMIEARPILGHGPGSYYSYIDEFRTRYTTPKNYVRYAHNEYLHILAEYGIVGFVLFAGILGYLIVRLLMLVRQAATRRDSFLVAGLLGAIVASLVQAFFDFNLHIFANMHVLVFFTAIVFAVLDGSDVLNRRKKQPSRVGAWIGVPVAIVCLVAALLAVQWFMVSSLDRKIRRLLYADLDSQAFSLALNRLCKQSIRLDPGYRVPYRFLGDDKRVASYWNVEDGGERIEQANQAITFYEKALEGNERDPDTAFGIAKAYELKGDLTQAEQLYMQLISHHPTRTDYRIQYGLFLKRQKKYQLAMNVFKEARDRDPRSRGVSVNIRLLSRKLLDNPVE